MFADRGRARSCSREGKRQYSTVTTKHVFTRPAHPSPFDHKRYAKTFRVALTLAGITDYVRPFHDGRHSSLTNAARLGQEQMPLMTLAGHGEFRTTQRYLHLAGQMFRDEGERMTPAFYGQEVPKGGTNLADQEMVEHEKAPR